MMYFQRSSFQSTTWKSTTKWPSLTERTSTCSCLVTPNSCPTTRTSTSSSSLQDLSACPSRFLSASSSLTSASAAELWWPTSKSLCSTYAFIRKNVLTSVPWLNVGKTSRKKAIWTDTWTHTTGCANLFVICVETSTQPKKTWRNIKILTTILDPPNNELSRLSF